LSKQHSEEVVGALIEALVNGILDEFKDADDRLEAIKTAIQTILHVTSNHMGEETFRDYMAEVLIDVIAELLVERIRQTQPKFAV